MKNVLLKFLILLSILVSSVFSDNINARKIMEKVNSRYEGQNQISNMEMILINKSSQKKVRKLRTLKQITDNVTKSILFFNYPLDVKGSGFLTYDYSDMVIDDEQWLYLPALQKTKRIVSSERSKSFMGSDFTYGDMKKHEINNYTYKILKSLKVNGHDTWVIEALPINHKVIEETGYTKSILFVQKDIYFIVRAVYFLKEGKKRKYLDIQELKQIKNIWIATRTTMTTQQGRKKLHQTILNQYNVKFDQDIDTSLLSLRGLKNGI